MYMLVMYFLMSRCAKLDVRVTLYFSNVGCSDSLRSRVWQVWFIEKFAVGWLRRCGG